MKVSREKIVALLTEDGYYRKLENWPLISFDRCLPFKTRKLIVKDCFTSPPPYDINPRMIKMTRFTTSLERKHPHLTELLTEFKGNLIACGGTITKTLFGFQSKEDVDLFFYDLEEERANELRLKVVEFLLDKWKTQDKKSKFMIVRNEFTTTIYVYLGKKSYIYQLIHRIYPNIATILGGFDLSASMIAYDGTELYTTPLGCWSLQHRAIIIDTKRRSTSFEYRLVKYHCYGFTLIFPGLTNEIIDQYIVEPCRKTGDLINKLKQLVDEYGYEFTGKITDHIKLKEDSGLRFDILQKENNILPYLYINDGHNYNRRYDYNKYYLAGMYKQILIGMVPYNRKQIEDRHVNNISDYNYKFEHPQYIAKRNITRLRVGNLAAVISVIEIDDITDLSAKLLNDIDHPDLKFEEDNIKFDKIIELRNYNSEDINKHYFNVFVKHFGKLAPEVIKNKDSDEFDKYIKIMVDTVKTNTKICQDNLTGIKWITKNPGRQWTASINPIIADPRDWYGKHYIPVVTGIPREIESCLRLARLRSIFNILPDDIFDLIMWHLYESYVDDALNYLYHK